MHPAAVDDGERAVVDRERGQVAFGSNDMQPFREEQVNLLDVLLERRVAGRIPFDKISGSQALAGVQGDVGWFEIGLAMSRAAGPLTWFYASGVRICECAIIAFLALKRKFRQRLHAQQA